jgi:hypothetical protein
VNYKIHTDAVRERLIPPQLTKAQISAVYATEADLLNVALFGLSAEQWRRENPKAGGNMRDAATIEQLVVHSNIESINSVLIRQKQSQAERLAQLNSIAVTQIRSLVGSGVIQKFARLGAAKKISR